MLSAVFARKNKHCPARLTGGWSAGTERAKRVTRLVLHTPDLRTGVWELELHQPNKLFTSNYFKLHKTW